MMQKPEILLIGGGGHCKSCIDVIEEEGKYNIFGIVDIPEKVGESILGYKIIGDDNKLTDLIKKSKNVLITLGHIKSPKLRISLFEKAIKAGAHFPSIISPKAHVSNHAIIGKGSIIMHGSVVNADATIGDNCIINSLSLIEHDAIIGNHSHVSTGARVNGNCKVGNDCFIGSGVVVNQGIHIDNNVIVGSASLVRKHIVEPGIYAGNPIKKYK